MKLENPAVFVRITIRCVGFAIYAVLFLVLGWIGTRLAYNMACPYDKGRLSREVVCEYNYLKALLDKPDPKTKTATDGWSNFQPSEWPFQVLSLFTYGTRNLTQAGLIPRDEAARYMKIALQRAMKPEYYNFIVPHFGDPFKDKEIKDNAFYLGHLTNMLALYREVSGDPGFDALFHKFAEAFYKNYQANPYSCLASYPGMTWTSEQAVPLRALKTHDVIFGTKYMEVVNRWEKTMNARYTEQGSGVLITGIDTINGNVWQGPRSIPNTWTILFLHQVLPDYCRQLYQNTKKAFGIKRLGFSLFSEWLHGGQVSDGDSGPIIWGASPAGTCFGMGDAGIYGDGEVFWGINILGDSIGLPVTLKDQRRYLLGADIGTACAYFCRSMAFTTQKKMSPYPAKKIVPLFLIVLCLLACVAVRMVFIIRYIRRCFRNKKA